jgi:protein-S-isoprenylcysteine O-methyltransferase Ste14
VAGHCPETPTRPAAPSGRRRAIAGPALTLLAVAAYGALHSLLASHAAKNAARRWLGGRADRVYRLAYNVIGTLTLLPVLAVPAAVPGETIYRWDGPWAMLALAGQLGALLLLLTGFLQTDPWHFLGLRQLAAPGPDEPSRLVVTGLYAWMRHPLYTAGLILVWLTPWLTTSLLAFNLSVTAYILIGSELEERRLIAEFGDAYRTYRRRVPRLLPMPWKRAVS